MNEATITIEVEVNPTEDLEKVKRAIENLFLPTSAELRAKERGSLFMKKSLSGKGPGRITGQRSCVPVTTGLLPLVP